jgi:hypothetical protein
MRTMRVSPSTTRVTLPFSEKAAEFATCDDSVSRVAAVAAKYPAAASTARNEILHRILFIKFLS